VKHIYAKKSYIPKNMFKRMYCMVEVCVVTGTNLSAENETYIEVYKSYLRD
jgi:hypothetical protein